MSVLSKARAGLGLATPEPDINDKLAAIDSDILASFKEECEWRGWAFEPEAARVAADHVRVTLANDHWLERKL